ncbi:MAG: hypothetical protein LBT40_18385 [Deltaproteobacteria bacterium]|nr:hypothetical protein [Deltaproteobacteria bacterium]
MDKDTILERLKELARRLDLAGIGAEMLIFGGAAMSLAYGSRRTTNDIDAVFSPRMDVMLTALDISNDMDLPADWLNSAGNIFISDDAPSHDFMDLPGLKLKIVAPDYLLAMKIKSSRPESKDFDDTKTLVDMLGIRTPEEAEALVRKYFPKFDLKPTCKQNLHLAFQHAN